MSEGIPEHIDLLRVAAQGGLYHGSVPIARMRRFADYLAEPDGDIDVNIVLGRDDRGRAYLEARMAGSVRVYCQRCLQVMDYEIDTGFVLLLVDAEHQLQQYEEQGIDAILVDTVPTAVIDILEDELILNMQLVPMHEASQCEARQYMQDRHEGNEQEPATEKPNPFSVLKDLKIDS